MDDFSNPGWRGMGYQFSEVSPKAQGYVRDHLRIPVDVATPIPARKLSVLDFISAKIPPVCVEPASYRVPPGHSFFCREMPSSNFLEVLDRVLIPPKTVVAELLPKATQQWMDGANSISVPGDDGYLPLWALQVWIEIYLTVLPVREAWQNGVSWLQREDLFPFKEQVHSIFHSLSTLSWYGNIVSPIPGRTSFPKTVLTGFLSRAWMTDEHVDQMMHLLEAEVKKSFASRNIHFLDTVLIRKITQAHVDEIEGKQSYDATDSTFLQKFGANLNEASQLGGIFHVRGNHWVAIAIDIAAQELLYGDPGASAPESAVIDALRWFLSKHIPSLPFDQLDDEILPCPSQNFQNDWFNCALFSYNALLHYFLPNQPLLQHTDNPVFGDLARISVLGNLVSLHIAASHLPDDLALPSEAFKGRQAAFEKTKPSTLKRPSTPPSQNTSNELTKAMKQLSVSPKKPKAKKRKTNHNVLAPVFQLSKATALGPKALEYHAKPENEKQPFESRKSKNNVKTESRITPEQDASVATEGSDDDRLNVVDHGSHGRPRLNVLDQVTIEVPTGGSPRKYRCCGPGCTKTWKPRTMARVLAHAKLCLKLTAAQRSLAASASAAVSPGALVAASSVSSVNHDLSKAATPSPVPTTSPALPRNDSSFFGPRSRKELHQSLDLAIVKLICVARLAPSLVDYQEWKDIYKLQTPSYVPASRTKLADSHIMSEQENVRQLQIAELKNFRRLSVSFDGGSIRSGESLYTVHATTPTRKVMLLEGQECTDESHTGEWIANLVFRVIDLIGLDRFIAVSADNTGNTRVAREIVTSRLPNILNLPDPNHHLNNTWKDIAALTYFVPTVQRIRGVIKFFKHSNHAKSLLKDLRERLLLGPGLESIGKTRFATLVWAAISLQRCLPAIRQLCVSGQINIPSYNNLFTQNMASLQFELRLTQFVAVGEGIARCIECLEATATNPADIYLYWLAMLARMRQTLETCALPDDVRGQIRGIINSRWQEFFISGPTNVHLSAFYLNPTYLRSSIFKNPNPLSFSITLPARMPSKVPPGVRNPKTFLEVGAYLHGLLVTEINHGSDKFLTHWKGRPQSFTKQYQSQFTAYAQGAYPFNIPLSINQSPLDWWLGYEGSENGGILAAIAIKLYSAVPHSMADERTMSAVTMLNTAQRNRQTVSTVVAMAQVGAYYRNARPSRVRKSAHPNPVIKFFNIERVLRSIDDDDAAAKLDANYDESDDEEEVDLSNRGAPPAPSVPSNTLPADGDDEDIDMASIELEEILADGPVARKAGKGPASSRPIVVASEDKEEGGSFELVPWV